MHHLTPHMLIGGHHAVFKFNFLPFKWNLELSYDKYLRRLRRNISSSIKKIWFERWSIVEHGMSCISFKCSMHSDNKCSKQDKNNEKISRVYAQTDLTVVDIVKLLKNTNWTKIYQKLEWKVVQYSGQIDECQLRFWIDKCKFCTKLSIAVFLLIFKTVKSNCVAYEKLLRSFDKRTRYDACESSS